MEKVKVRINNSHKHIWAVVWNGQPEDFSDAKDITLIASVRDKRINLTQGVDYVIEGNLVKIDFTPRFCKNTGVYNIELNYTKPSESFLSGERRTAVDLNVIEIVGTSACADATDETSSVSEAAFGFQGLSAYEVWLKDNPDKTKEDYFNWLQKPATDAVSLIDDKIEHLDEIIDSSTENEAERVTAEIGRQTAEGLRGLAEADRETAEGLRVLAETARINAEGDATKGRVKAENERVTAETSRKTAEGLRVDAELLRQSSESERNENEGLRVQAESLRATAETSRQTAESLRVDAELLRQSSTQEAILNAENATENANTAAQNADDAREAIQSDLALKADQADLVQFESDVNLLRDDATVKMENLVVNGDFRNGLNGWTTGASYNSLENGMLTNTGSGTTVAPHAVKGITGKWAEGHKYYCKCKVRANSNMIRMYINTTRNSSSDITIETIIAPIQEQWYDISAIYSTSTNAIDTNSGFRIIHEYSTIADSAGKSIYIEYAMWINLTKTFGEGNEPTKEEMDLLISTLGIDYFEGEITIPAQKIMQWQLALIRKNKNAIIALGGTII